MRELEFIWHGMVLLYRLSWVANYQRDLPNLVEIENKYMGIWVLFRKIVILKWKPLL